MIYKGSHFSHFFYKGENFLTLRFYAFHILTCMLNYSLFSTYGYSEVAQSCLTLCDPMDCSLPGSSVHGIFQARVLEWVAISFFGYLSNPGVKPRSPALQADALPSEPPGKQFMAIVAQYLPTFP